jgi:murein DD-endopeptidase MepM/ murein hydrolase activator NlpD
VRDAGYNAFGYGNLVIVTHRLGFESWYAHLSSISVVRGQSVSGGVVIGRVGSTGHSTGPHLHFEVRRNGTPIDPVPLLLP